LVKVLVLLTFSRPRRPAEPKNPKIWVKTRRGAHPLVL
jgi:hypothetical protein